MFSLQLIIWGEKLLFLLGLLLEHLRDLLSTEHFSRWRISINIESSHRRLLRCMTINNILCLKRCMFIIGYHIVLCNVSAQVRLFLTWILQTDWQIIVRVVWKIIILSWLLLFGFTCWSSFSYILLGSRIIIHLLNIW